MTIAALILAAGTSSRMQHEQNNYHKLLLPLGQGTVLSHVLSATLTSQARPVILILGHQSMKIRASLAPYIPSLNANSDTTQDDIIMTENTAYARGMSTSLHTGIHILMQRNEILARGESSFPRCEGALVLLGDQPLITPSLLNQLIERKYATGKRIIAPLYNGKRGNPVLFDATLFPELLAVTGDEGGRSVIEKHRTDVSTIDIDDTQSWYDVDTWEAYQQVLHSWENKRDNEAGV
jgi:molybdenum cofactor cytidylyltransferase